MYSIIQSTKLSKEFLLTLLSYVDPPLYCDFYNTYKEVILKRAYKEWSDYNVEITNDIINDIKNFVPVNSNNKNSRSFRLSKNHKSTNIFNQILGVNQHNEGI